MTNEDRENAVLASFLYSNDIGLDTKDAFQLAEDAFTSDFRRRVAVKINATTAVDRAYAYLSYELENAIEGTVYEMDWVNILAQTPLPFSLAKRYHSDIVSAFNNTLIY